MPVIVQLYYFHTGILITIYYRESGAKLADTTVNEALSLHGKTTKEKAAAKTTGENSLKRKCAK